MASVDDLDKVNTVSKATAAQVQLFKESDSELKETVGKIIVEAETVVVPANDTTGQTVKEEGNDITRSSEKEGNDIIHKASEEDKNTTEKASEEERNESKEKVSEQVGDDTTEKASEEDKNDSSRRALKEESNDDATEKMCKEDENDTTGKAMEEEGNDTTGKPSQEELDTDTGSLTASDHIAQEATLMNNTTNNAAEQSSKLVKVVEPDKDNAAIVIGKSTIKNAAEPDESEKPILETLTFGIEQEERVKVKEDDQSIICPCLLCDIAYSVVHKEHILAHLVMQHKIVIADVTFIADLPAYLKYWKKRFEGNNWTEFCSTIVTNKEYEKPETNGPKEEFYLLCDALAEDKQLRANLQQKRLEFILGEQQKERMESQFFRQCIFCKQSFGGNRSVLFEHLLNDHSFHMGLPDNLVFTDELFDLIQFKLDNHLCLFCEKKFRDKTALREHMRKKQHRKINPKNKEYDRFYIINYMEVGKNWESLQSEERRLRHAGDDRHSDEEEEWAGWNEESGAKVVCLFCDQTWNNKKEVHDHMKTKHNFDLHQVAEKLQLNFYQKIKLINYIRRQVYHKRCYGCKKIFPEKMDLLEHMEKEAGHLLEIPETNIWDQPQYFFPTYEDDSLLCLLDDNDDDGAAGDALGVTVIAEDIKISKSIFDDADLCKDLKKL